MVRGDLHSLTRRKEGPMASLMWAGSAKRLHEEEILRFLYTVQFPVNLVEVSSVFSPRLETRFWEPAGDLQGTAKDISRYIADGGFVHVKIMASDEIYRFDPRRRVMSFNPTRWV
jgi:hypothetical protein